MSRIGIFGLGLACAACAFGQYHPRTTYGSNAQSGFGSVLFPGTGGPPPVSASAGFPAGLGRTVRGGGYYGGYGGYRRVAPRYNQGNQTVVVPYAYPVFVGGGYGYGGYGNDAPPPQEYAPPQQQAPTVIINQNFIPETVRPVVREYGDLPEPGSSMRSYEAPPPSPMPAPAGSAEAANQTIYLIAFRDHSIYSAIAYWVEGDTLNYVTPQGVHNRASLGLIDEAFSKQLNGERNLDFRLKK